MSSYSSWKTKTVVLINPTPGSHCAVNRADHLCPAVQHALLPLHVDDQRQQGVLHPEREGRSRPCSESSHDPQGLPLHAAAGKNTKKTEFGQIEIRLFILRWLQMWSAGLWLPCWSNIFSWHLPSPLWQYWQPWRCTSNAVQPESWRNLSQIG